MYTVDVIDKDNETTDDDDEKKKEAKRYGFD